jgi:hypothetical protein
MVKYKVEDNDKNNSRKKNRRGSNLNNNINRKLKRQQQQNLQNRHSEVPQNQITVPDNQFKYYGCNENTRFGIWSSKNFLDARKKRSDIKTLVRLHNNNAGRQVWTGLFT